MRQGDKAQNSVPVPLLIQVTTEQPGRVHEIAFPLYYLAGQRYKSKRIYCEKLKKLHFNLILFILHFQEVQALLQREG